MVKIGNFTVHSDFPSLANDGNVTMSVTIPNGWVAPFTAGHTYVTKDYAVGSTNSSIRARITVDGTNWYVGTSASFYKTVRFVDGSTFSAPFFVSIYRTSPTNIRLEAGLYNQFGDNVTSTSDTTITAQVATFKTPF